MRDLRLTRRGDLHAATAAIQAALAGREPAPAPDIDAIDVIDVIDAVDEEGNARREGGRAQHDGGR